MPNPALFPLVPLGNVSSSGFRDAPLLTSPPSLLPVTFRPDLPLNFRDFWVSQPWHRALVVGSEHSLSIYYTSGTRLCQPPGD